MRVDTGINDRVMADRMQEFVEVFHAQLLRTVPCKDIICIDGKSRAWYGSGKRTQSGYGIGIYWSLNVNLLQDSIRRKFIWAARNLDTIQRIVFSVSSYGKISVKSTPTKEGVGRTDEICLNELYQTPSVSKPKIRF